MTRVAWFHAFAGIAGDMALGSLVDAGADPDAIRDALQALPFGGWTLDFATVMRGGIAATHATVHVEDVTTSRTAADVTAMVGAADLAPRARARALAVFDALSRAEGAIHDQPPEAVHFHEVGGHDAIVDIVGTAVALELLDVDEVRAGPVALGHGMLRGAHGMLPNPPPAVLALLQGVPVVGRDLPFELTTPTGAAILAALSAGFGPVPDLVVESTGYGAATREIDGLPNCTQVVIGTTRRVSDAAGQPLALVEANLDDVTGEVLADTLDALLRAGAQDAWITPVVMKKGRPGHLVTALCTLGALEGVRGTLLAESGSFGARVHVVDRFATTREMANVVVDGHDIAIKVNGLGWKVEHDDAARAATALGLPVRVVIARAAARYARDLETE